MRGTGRVRLTVWGVVSLVLACGADQQAAVRTVQPLGQGALTGCDDSRRQSCLDAVAGYCDQLSTRGTVNPRLAGTVRRLVGLCGNAATSPTAGATGEDPICADPETACGITPACIAARQPCIPDVGAECCDGECTQDLANPELFSCPGCGNLTEPCCPGDSCFVGMCTGGICLPPETAE